MKKVRKIKSLGYILTMMFLPVFILLILMSLIRGETMPPDWVIMLIAIVTGGIFISAIIIRKRDILTPERQYNLAKYLRSPFIIYLIYIFLISSFDILANIHETPPVDYNKLLTIFFDTIGYIFALTVIWLICITLFLKMRRKLTNKRNERYRNTSIAKTGSYIFLFILFALMLFGLRVVIIKIYGYYNTDYSRYGDIASFMCVVGGILGVGLILCIQNRSRFIPFKILDSLVEKVLIYDKRQRESRKKSEKK